MVEARDGEKLVGLVDFTELDSSPYLRVQSHQKTVPAFICARKDSKCFGSCSRAAGDLE